MTLPQLTLTNSLTRSKVVWQPKEGQKEIGLYVCGVTPYDHAHIGHARVYVVFDVFYRLLKHLYEPHGIKVKYVRNFTDIDDKIIARAAEQGKTPEALAQEMIDSFHADMDKLGCLRPDFEPRVTDKTVMDGIIEFIQALLAKDAAYTTSDGVYLDTSKVEKSDEYHYGKLSGKKLEELVAGARVEVNPEKRNAGDFALWKLAKPGEPKWDAPWGAGRPGWHIECSVMSAQLLGERFDFHGGGEDLQFPHHENELAQSVACHGHIHADIWLHNAFITVDGRKMSKSLGNFTTIKDALKDFSPEAIRLWLLQTHYRKPVDYSEEALKAAGDRVEKLVRKSLPAEISQEGAFYKPTLNVAEEFIEALSQDLNTSKALAVVDKSEDTVQRLDMLAMLGIKLFREQSISEMMDEERLTESQLELITARNTARANKDWAESDRLRDALKEQGIILEDGPNGTTWKRV